MTEAADYELCARCGMQTVTWALDNIKYWKCENPGCVNEGWTFAKLLQKQTYRRHTAVYRGETSAQLARLERMVEGLIADQAIIMERHRAAVETITTLARMIEGGRTSQDYPDNLPGLVGEMVEELTRFAGGGA